MPVRSSTHLLPRKGRLGRLGSLVSLGSLGSLVSLVSLVSLGSLVSLVSLGSLVSLVSLECQDPQAAPKCSISEEAEAEALLHHRVAVTSVLC